MTVDRTTGLFFDATCLFAAAHSPTGGSAFILQVCASGFLKAIVSPSVLIEAERNLLAKSTGAAFLRFRQLVTATPLTLTSAPDEASVRALEPTFFEDAHVVAAALAARAEYLLTLDQRLARRIEEVNLPIIGISPRRFIQSALPTHPDFLRIRDVET